MPQRLLGLDVGTHSLKAVGITGGFRGFEVTVYAESPRRRPPDGGAPDLGAEITDFLAEHRLQADVVVAAMPGDKAAVRTLTLPARKIEQTLPFELEDQIPFPLDEVVHDHRLLSRDADQASVLVAFCRREHFDAFLDALAAADLDPRVVGVDALAYGALFGAVIEPAAEGLEAVVDIGHDHTGVCVLEQGKVVAGRLLQVGGARVTGALAQEYQLTAERAEAGKRVDGFIATDADPADGTEQARISDTIRAALAPLLRELKQTFRAVEVERGVAVQRVHLCGGSASLRNLDRHLAARLDLEVAPLEIPEERLARLPEGAAAAPVLARPLALALQGLGGARAAPINFRRGSYAFRGDTQAMRGRLIQAGAMITAIVALLVANGASRLYFLGSEETRVTDQLKSISKEIIGQPFSEPKKVLSIVKEEIREGAGGAVGLPEVTALEAFREIANRMPVGESLELAELNIGEKRCKIKGTTDNLSTVSAFEENLKGYRCFSKITKGRTRVRPDGTGLDFSIDMNLACHEVTEKAAEPAAPGETPAGPPPGEEVAATPGGEAKPVTPSPAAVAPQARKPEVAKPPARSPSARTPEQIKEIRERRHVRPPVQPLPEGGLKPPPPGIRIPRANVRGRRPKLGPKATPPIRPRPGRPGTAQEDE